jgi:outer membrane protein with beta-barrel domain
MRTVLLAIVAIAFSATTQAQTTSFGLKAGMTGSNMKMSSSGFTISLKTKIGFYAGAFAEVGVSEKFAVQPELFYSSMGAKMKLSDSGQNFSATENLGYISLPILAKYKTDGFSIFLGPQISYLLSAKSKDSESNSSVDDKDEYKPIEIAGVIGAGYTFTNNLGIDARYQVGLSNLVKDNEGTDGTAKNSAFMVGLHYFFNR